MTIDKEEIARLRAEYLKPGGSEKSDATLDIARLLDEIERLTRERDEADATRREFAQAVEDELVARTEKAEAACAAMRAALCLAIEKAQQVAEGQVNPTARLAAIERAGLQALATDAGRGLMEVVEGMVAALKDAVCEPEINSAGKGPGGQSSSALQRQAKVRAIVEAMLAALAAYEAWKRGGAP